MTGNALRALGLAAAGILLTLLLLEISSLALISLHPGWPSRSEIQSTLAVTSEEPPTAGIQARRSNLPQLRDFVLHPYLGFVRNSELRGHRLNRRMVGKRVNDQGFFGPSPLDPVEDDGIVVAITGGSVAAELFLYAGDALRDELARRGFADRRPVRLVSLALAGMKQPQQVQALSYFLALGAHFDVLVNLDGFNEVALPVIDNLPTGVPAHFPRNWRLYSAKALDEESILLAGRIAESRAGSERWAERLGRFPLRESNLVLALWHAAQRSSEAKRSELELALRRRVEEQNRVEEKVRNLELKSDVDSEELREAVDLWRRSTLLLEALSRAYGIIYLHVLQPNQYFPGGRSLTEQERSTAIAPADYKYRVAAERGYPMLVEAAAQLAAVGHPVIDGTAIVADEPQSVYRDTCCHLTQRGNRLLAAAIAEALSQRSTSGLGGGGGGPEARTTAP